MYKKSQQRNDENVKVINYKRVKDRRGGADRN